MCVYIYIFSNKTRTEQPNIKIEAVNKFFNIFFLLRLVAQVPSAKFTTLSQLPADVCFLFLLCFVSRSRVEYIHIDIEQQRERKRLIRLFISCVRVYT